ncbi:MAG: TolC family protein [Treponema sp.]|jgi:outer membrane protein TolC|nr:TolC family protein [Treponema sp.]
MNRRGIGITKRGAVKTVLLLFLILAAAFPPAAFSAEPGLEDIRRAAVAASPELRKLETSKQNQILAKMAYYFRHIPSLRASANASYNLLPKAPTPALDRLDAGAALSISGTLSIFDGGKSKIERANLALDESALDAQTQARLFAVMEEADSRYFACLEAEAAVKTAELQAQIGAVALETAEIRREGGILSPSDYYLALSNKSAADSSLAAAQTGLALARRRLEQLTGSAGIADLLPLDFGDYEDLLGAISRWTMEEISARFLKLKEILASRSPALKSAYITLKRAENEYSLAKSAFWPSLDLSASFNLGYDFMQISADPLSYGASLSLSGTIPLDYWTLINSEQRQKNSLENSRLDYEDTLASFDIDLQSQLFTLAGNARTLIANRRQAEYSALLLEQQQELFHLSSVSMASFLDAASRSLSGETQKNRAEFSFLRSLSALKSLGAFGDDELLSLLGG